MIEKGHDKTNGGVWVAENAACLPQRVDKRSEKIPAGFSREYHVLAELCASMSSGFMLLNPHERVAYSNDSALRLLRLKCQNSTQDTFSFQDFDVSKHLLSIAADPQQARSELEYAWSHPEQEYSADLALADAATNWLRVRSFPVRDEQGQLLGRGVLLDDITLERTAADSRAETLMMAAHELKTPLAIIKGCATTLLGGSARWDPAMQREMLQMIDAQSDRLYDVLNTLLDVWRFDSGTQPLRLSQVQFSELLLQLVTRWQKQAPEHRFILDLPDGAAPVTCDALRIEQVLNHLLNNAVTFSATDKIVRIQLEANDEEIRVSVSDEGEGIAPEHLERIFDRFYRIPPDEKRSHPASSLADTHDSLSRRKGSGLGLASARSTIEAHHGKIWAESAGVGQGATFYFTLPYTTRSTTATLPPLTTSESLESSPHSQQTRPLPALLKQDRRMRVLLAENDARLARYIRANLEEQQYRVLTVNHGIQFLRQLDLEDPDVIILASRLSDMSGVELLQRLREFSHAPVMVLSDACSEDERVQFFDLGCDDLMLKPFGMRELLARVRALLRRQTPQAERPQTQSTFTTGDLTIDFAQHAVTVKGRPVQLSRTEYKLLSTLAQNVGLVVTHELLLEKVWGPEYNRDIDFIWVYISRLRRKIETNSRRPEYILTVPDVGYKLAKL
jgi:DNA-binding response OmpR family regulator/signal transduction histidine kinase